MLQTEVERDGDRRPERTRATDSVPRPGPLPGPWRNGAACRSLPPALFFPDVDGPDGEADVDRALSVCGRCDVRGACFEFALATNQVGIWGGTTEQERRATKRARRRQRARAQRIVS